jgi:hypothetical protein
MPSHCLRRRWAPDGWDELGGFSAGPQARRPGPAGVRTVRHGATGPALISAPGMTGRLQLAFGALLTIGLAIRL